MNSKWSNFESKSDLKAQKTDIEIVPPEQISISYNVEEDRFLIKHKGKIIVLSAAAVAGLYILSQKMRKR